MYKKYLLVVCALFVLEVKSDCDGYFECFNSFFANFFTNNDADVEYLNTTSKNLPEDFKVKEVQISEVDKVLSDISSFIQQDISDNLKTQSNAAFFENVNPKTKVYVKTFTYNNPGNVFLPDFENVYFDHELSAKDVAVEDRLSMFSPMPPTTTKRDEIKLIPSDKDISENEIPLSDDILTYYDSVEDNSTDYPAIDYVEMYKDVTNEENVYNSTENSVGIQEEIVEYRDNLDNVIEDNSTDVFPWISAIFIKNDSKSNRFEYYCDGALLNERLLITAARCVIQAGATVDPDTLLVILGKRSLQSMADKEQAVKVKQIITHENFTNDNGKIENDLALLLLENDVVFNDVIQPAIIGNDTDELDKSYTTAWNLQGELVSVAFEDNEDQACKSNSMGEHMFCVTYGLNVPLCPSYGGIFAGYQADWRLYGIRAGDTTDRGLCFNKDVWFTDLRAYEDWIANNME